MQLELVQSIAKDISKVSVTCLMLAIKIPKFFFFVVPIWQVVSFGLSLTDK